MDDEAACAVGVAYVARLSACWFGTECDTWIALSTGSGTRLNVATEYEADEEASAEGWDSTASQYNNLVSTA